MQRKQASDFPPEAMRMFDQYVHGQIDRRGFFHGVAKYAVGGVSASMLLDALSPRFAEARQIAKDDRRINAGRSAYDEEALTAAGVKYEAFTYPNTQHGFNNDTTPRYDKAAADLAWQRTVAFFHRNLRG